MATYRIYALTTSKKVKELNLQNVISEKGSLLEFEDIEAETLREAWDKCCAIRYRVVIRVEPVVDNVSNVNIKKTLLEILCGNKNVVTLSSLSQKTGIDQGTLAGILLELEIHGGGKGVKEVYCGAYAYVA